MSMIKWWEWGNEGAELHDDHLTWFEKEGAVRFASGAACDQSFEDFFQRGPHVDGVPADILAEVNQALRDHLAGRKATSNDYSPRLGTPGRGAGGEGHRL
ncbi:MAG: hypothetical protein JWN70_7125 [Planctomycetaceae bacterium]|nr:hypothetical protein [Planctomycetaceae bacterium]